MTVIQSKTKQHQMYAMKEFIVENDQCLQNLELRKKLHHPNLISLKQHWFTTDQSICSNLRSVCLMFELCRRNLADEIQSKIQNKEIFPDFEIVQAALNIIRCLQLLEENGFIHLIGSVKSILMSDKGNKLS